MSDGALVLSGLASRILTIKSAFDNLEKFAIFSYLVRSTSILEEGN
jgi:hypothetical protein